MSAHNRIGYVLSTYPVYEQSFIRREIRELRKNRFDILPFSLRRPNETQVKSAEEHDELNRTFYLRDGGIRFIAGAHARLLLSAPFKFIVGALYALRLPPTGLKSLLWHFFYFGEAVCLVEWARAARIAHVHVHIAGSACSVALIAYRMGGPTFSLTEHGPYAFDNCDSLYLTRKLSRSKAVICISDYCRSQAMRQVDPLHWEKLYVARLGVDIARFAPNQAVRIGKEPVSILCVARLTPTKGQRLLVEACAELRDRGILFDCSIVGAGPDSEPLRQMIREFRLDKYVRLTGGVCEVEVRRFCEEADIFVLSSLAEGIPVVLMEAMAMEVPVISTRIMGIPELVDDNVNGLLVPPANVEALADAMERLAKDPELRRRLGKAGREKVIAEYNLETNVAKLAEILRRAASPEHVDDGALADIAQEVKAQ